MASVYQSTIEVIFVILLALWIKVVSPITTIMLIIVFFFPNPITILIATIIGEIYLIFISLVIISGIGVYYYSRK